MAKDSLSPLQAAFIPLPIDQQIIERALKLPSKRIFIGFDGFTDSISALVQKRADREHFTRYSTLKSFGQAILQAGDKSANFELALLETRVGGNAANLAKALCFFEQKVYLAATLGDQSVEPLFANLAKECAEIFLLGPSDSTDAVEFSDGKLLLGKMKSLLDLSLDKIIDLIGADTLFHQLEKCDLFASLNWTMLPAAQKLWTWLRNNCFAALSKKQRFFLVDLSDPRKRAADDLLAALNELKCWQTHFEVILSLNIAESEQVAAALGLIEPQDMGAIVARKRRSFEIQQRLSIKGVVIHGPDLATAAADQKIYCAVTNHCQNPQISTGGGDHFNAGLCLGLLAQLGWPEVLALANATSSYFVRWGRCPDRKELLTHLSLWQSQVATHLDLTAKDLEDL